MHYLIFDIETGAEPDNVLEALFAFDETTAKNYHLLGKEFDPSEVRCGNLKDPAKIEAKIEAARQAFTAAKETVAENIASAKAEAWQEFKDRAALSPLTGRVLAIGSMNAALTDGIIHYVHDGIGDIAPVSEKDLIENFLELADAVLSDSGRLVGHNIVNFDIPFLLRRGLKYGIRPPKTIMTALGQYRPTNLVDTMREWQMGNRAERFVKLDQLAAFFGVRRKTGDGADFGRLFFGSPEERLEALAYCLNDVVMTLEVAVKMGLVKQPVKPVTKQPETQSEPSQAETETKQDDDIY